MMITNSTLYALGDITIIPAVTSEIRHRSECNVEYDMAYPVNGKSKMLPIFTAPMASVVSKDNYEIWSDNGIIPILPRTESVNLRTHYASNGKWAAFGLDEFENIFTEETIYKKSKGFYRVLIDIANGHIKQIQEVISKAKNIAKENNVSIEIMAGNVANPLTYQALAEAGADYVRCAVGSGSVCITASNTSIHYPMASLIDECAKIKKMYNLSCAIIADGGINSYSNAIKALAVGADYIMMGSTLAKCFESAGKFINDELDINDIRFKPVPEDSKKHFINTMSLKKTIFGMSTRKAQTLILKAQGKSEDEIKTKTSEGIEKTIPVEYTVKQWTDNFKDYLKSSMSYCNARTLNDFIYNVKICLLSESAKNSINK